jgi:hypothetical protein
VDVFVEPGSGTPTGGDAFGLDAYAPGVLRLAAATVRADGAVVLEDGAGGGPQVSAAVTAAPGRWNRLELFLDLLTGVATVSVNGVDAGLSAAFAPGSLVADVDLYAAPDGAAASPAAAYFDDYRAEARAGVPPVAVPEPGALTLLLLAGAAAAGMAGVRRRRAAPPRTGGRPTWRSPGPRTSPCPARR